MQIPTKDTSITLYSARFNETYHHVGDGALEETLCKHVLPLLSLQKDARVLRVLDICFGLGFNVLCLYHALKQHRADKLVFVESPEIEFFSHLKEHPYPKQLEIAPVLIQALEEECVFKEKDFSVRLHLGDARGILEGFLKEIQAGKREKFNAIFQDPFSPLKNPSLWTYEYFKVLNALSSDDVVITTYSQNSCMLYSAFLAGFHAWKLRQKHVRDSIIFTKTQAIPNVHLEFIKEVVRVDLVHKIKTNIKLRGLYD